MQNLKTTNIFRTFGLTYFNVLWIWLSWFSSPEKVGRSAVFFKGQGQKKDAKSMRKTMFALVILLWTSSVSAQIGVFDYYDSFGETGSHYRGKYIGELSTYHHQVSTYISDC